MKNLFVILALIVCGTAYTAEQYYFGAYHDQVHYSLHPARNVLEDTLKEIGVAINNDQNWSGTDVQAHNLVRRVVIRKHNIEVPDAEDLDNPASKADVFGATLRGQLIKKGYDEAEIDTFIEAFGNLTHPEE